MGSTTALANEDGTLKTLMRYTAYGEIRAAYGSDQATDYRYTGQRSEGEIGLYFYVSRFYDPALGRFIQPDSIIPDPGSSKGSGIVRPECCLRECVAIELQQVLGVVKGYLK